MKKKALFLLLSSLFIILVAGCSQGGTDGGNQDIQIVHIVADEWAFTPDTVEVKTGQVKLVIENKGKVMHGIGNEELNLKENIPPGKTVETIIQIDKPGTYEFQCNVLCGPLNEHNKMKGTIIAK